RRAREELARQAPERAHDRGDRDRSEDTLPAGEGPEHGHELDVAEAHRALARAEDARPDLLDDDDQARARGRAEERAQAGADVRLPRRVLDALEPRERRRDRAHERVEVPPREGGLER